MVVSPTSGNGHIARCFIEDVLDFRSWARRAEEKALDFIAALLGEARKLLLRFNALGGCRDPQAAAQSDNGSNDGHAVLFRRQVADKGLIDLDLVERETAQIA